jgi:hypothetical protein
MLQHCGFSAASHLTAAGHTLIACMLRSSDLAFEHRPDLLTAIDLVSLFADRYPCVESAAQLLVQLSRTLDLAANGGGRHETAGIRVLARKMSASPSTRAPIEVNAPAHSPTVAMSGPLDWHRTFQATQSASSLPSAEKLDNRLTATQKLSRSLDEAGSITVTAVTNALGISSSFNMSSDLGAEPVVFPTTDPNSFAGLGDNFSFLNDGLFSYIYES